MADNRTYRKVPAGNTPELGKTAGTAGRKAAARRVMIANKSAKRKVR